MSAHRYFTQKLPSKRIFLIDLKHLEPHECHLAMNVIVGDLKPSITDFGCDELFHIAVSLRLWVPCEQYHTSSASFSTNLFVQPSSNFVASTSPLRSLDMVRQMI